MTQRSITTARCASAYARSRGFTLAEAVIASAFVGIALTAILSLAPAMIRGQHEIAERSRAHAAASELLGMFERHELPSMQSVEPAEHSDQSGRGGLFGSVGNLLGALTPTSPDDALGSTEPEPITTITTAIRGFDGELHLSLVDPITLDPDTPAKTTALITVVIRSNDRELARLHVIRTDAWSHADQRRSFGY